jgi:predicted PurR-regulated permease PerM
MPRGLVIPLGTAAVVITVAGVRAVAWLIAPALLALVIVITLSPAHKWLRRRGFLAWAATSALVVLVYGVLLVFGLVVIVSVAKLVALVPHYTERLRAIGGHAADLAGRLGIEPKQAREVTNSLDLGKLVTAAGHLLGGLTGLTTSLVFLLALLLFFSAETSGIDRRLAEIARDRPRIRLALHDFAGRTRRYLVVTTVFGLVIAVVDVVALLWLGIPLALLWGLLPLSPTTFRTSASCSGWPRPPCSACSPPAGG